MIIDLTVVRIKESKEIVGIFEHEQSLIELFWKVDQILSPLDCEYTDMDHVEIPFEILFSISKKDLKDEDDDCINFFGEIGERMNIEISNLIDESDFYEFTGFEHGIDYLEIESEINSEIF
jgi:hypothetical protein